MINLISIIGYILFILFIEGIKIYLMTPYRVSESYYTGSTLSLFQGVIQSNRAIFPGFILIVIILVRALYASDLVLPSISPIF